MSDVSVGIPAHSHFEADSMPAWTLFGFTYAPCGPTRSIVMFTLSCLFAALSSAAIAAGGIPPRASATTVDAAARDHAALLAADADARTPTQLKLTYDLLQAVRVATGRPAVKGAENVHVARADANTRFHVRLRGEITPTLLAFLSGIGATDVQSLPEYGELSARVPADRMELLAARREVKRIRLASPAHHSRRGRAPTPAALPGQPPRAPITKGPQDPQGDLAHNGAAARSQYNIGGHDRIVCVISDDVKYLSEAKANGSLPDVKVYSGMAGPNDQSATGEGTAMLEIVHRIAPDAVLRFASGAGGSTEMAVNIGVLAKDGCDIIVDDLSYTDDPPFQEGPISRVIDAASIYGVLFVSSAGNDGNAVAGTAGTWEGPFASPGAPSANNRLEYQGTNYILQPFATGEYWNTVVKDGGDDPDGCDTDETKCPRATLYWSDVINASTSQYRLFVRSQTGSLKHASIADAQGAEGEASVIIEEGDQLAIGQVPGTPTRRVRMTIFDGMLKYGTNGGTAGHNAAAHVISVASISAFDQTGPFGLNPGLNVDSSSSDGPRVMVWTGDGVALSKTNPGVDGMVLNKPDITAADCVTTDLPAEGWDKFCGTSAAAPHVAAIAALIGTAVPPMRPEAERSAMIENSLHFDPAWNPNSGYGVVMADLATQFAVGLPLVHMNFVPPTAYNATVAFGASTLTLGTLCKGSFWTPTVAGPLFDIAVASHADLQGPMRLAVSRCAFYNNELGTLEPRILVNGNQLSRQIESTVYLDDGSLMIQDTYEITPDMTNWSLAFNLQFVADTPNKTYSVSLVSLYGSH